MTHLKSLACFVSLLAMVGAAFGQAEARCSLSDSSNNVYQSMASQTNATTFVGRTVKRSSSGSLLWFKDFSSMKYVAQIQLDSSGNVYVAGSSDTAYYLLKYNASGTLQWNKSYTESGSFFARSTGLATDGTNVYLTGYSFTSSTGTKSRVIAYNPSGTVLWNNLIQPLSNSEMGTVLYYAGTRMPGDPAALYVQGRAYNSTQGGIEVYSFSPSTGATNWNVYTPLGTNIERGLMALDASGNPTVIASQNLTTSRSFTLQKLNNAGTVLWQTSPVTTGFYPNCMVFDSAGNIDVSGNTPNPSTSSNAWMIARFDGASGAALWNQTYYRSSSYAYSITPDLTGNLMVAGSLYDAGGTNSVDVRISQVDISTGSELMWWQWNIAPNDGGYKVLPISTTDFFVTGTSDLNSKASPLAMRFSGGSMIWNWITQ